MDVSSLARLAAAVAALAALGACDNAVDVDLPALPAGEEPALCLDEAPGPRAVQLLTRAEYDRAVRDLLQDTTAPAKRTFPPENVLIGYENDAENHQASPLLVELYLNAAEDIARRAVAERRAQVVPCDPAAVGDAPCGALVIETFGRRAFRRPLLQEETETLQTVFDTVTALEGFDTGVEAVVTAVLSSPQFLYRVDASTGGFTQSGGAEVALVGPYEMASRLSFLLWGSIPDETLLAAAEDGSLLTRAGVEAEARRLLADERAKEGVGSFFRQWLNADTIDGLTKDAATFPSYQEAMRQSWRRSLEAFVDGVVWSGSGTMRELFSSEDVYVDALLAPVYGVDVAGVDFTAGLSRQTAPDGPRAGLLTQPALMALLADPDQSSPIRRGVYVRERLLCQHIPPPPAELNVEPPDPDPSLTTRERFAVHTSEASCRGCHELIDPIGFGFEQYDALGRYREFENSLLVDASGELAHVDEPAVEGPFTGGRELGLKLAASTMVRDCLIDQLFRFSMGRSSVEADTCTLQQTRDAFEGSEGNIRELLVALAASDAFRTTENATVATVGGAP